MKVIILAGGQGTRLPQSAKNIPKPLVKIGNKTLLDYQIAILENFGLSDIRLSLGYLAEKVVNHLKYYYGNKYEWVIEKERLGTGGGLKFASQDLDDDFLALNVDDFPKINLSDFINFHQNHQIDNTIAIYQVEDARDFGLVRHNNGIIEEFLEKPAQTTSGYINTGLYVINPHCLRAFPQKCFSIEKDIFPALAQQKKLAGYDNVSHWFTTGTEERLKEAMQYLMEFFS